MPVAPELLSTARKYHISAAASLLESYYPLAHRLAYALTGDAAVAEGVLRQVMKRALLVLPRWRDETLPDRWFYHHTVLAARSAVNGTHTSRADDPMIPTVAAAPYVAFIRALRAIPAQQREAIVLHYGERLNARFIGIAMDCSADAASAHLAAAAEAMERMTGDAFPALATEFTHVYRALAPSPPAIAQLHGRVARFIWPRRFRKWVNRLVIVALLAAAAWGGWHYRHLLPLPGSSTAASS